MYLDGAPRYPQSVFDVADLNRSNRQPEAAKIREYTALYMAEITAVDNAVQQLISDLAVQNRLNRTQIIITADHGESLDEHNYYFAHGEHLYDPSLRVPLITTLPKKYRKNRVAHGQFRLASLAGVIYNLSEVESGSSGIASGVMKIWKGLASKFPPTYTFCETGAGIFTAAHSASDDHIRMKTRAVRSNGKKLILNEKGQITGYNLEENPQEDNPLNQDPMFAELAVELTDYIRQMDPPEKRSIDMPDEDALKKLQMLGYID